MPRHEVLREQLGEGGRAARRRRRDGGPSDGAPLAIVGAPIPVTVALEDVEEGAGVEAVPSEPEEEGPEDDEGGAMAAEGNRAASVVESTNARALDEGPPQRLEMPPTMWTVPDPAKSMTQLPRRRLLCVGLAHLSLDQN